MMRGAGCGVCGAEVCLRDGEQEQLPPAGGIVNSEDASLVNNEE